MRWILAVISLTVLAISNANAVIIDLNSRVNDVANPVSLALDPGTYTINPIGTADGGTYNAWNAWGRTTCENSDGCQRTRPTTVIGWLNLYSFGSSDLVDVMVNGVAATPNGSGNYSVDSFMAYPDPLSALADAWSAMFTLETSSILNFAIPDRPLYDNRGGMSLDVVRTDIPEPAGIILMGIGLLGLASRKLIQKNSD
jgi:hypothetical protein